MIALHSRPLRVMHVLHSLGAGGAERIVYDLARLRGAELRTLVVCLDALGPLEEPLRALGAEIHCTGRRPGIDLPQVSRLAALIRRSRPDVIHAHQYTPYFYAALGASAAGFGRILFTEHGRHYPDVVSPARQATNQLLRLRRDRITAVCGFVADALRHTERLGGRNVRIIPNGIDASPYQSPARASYLREQIAAPENALLLIQVARLHPVKDHATSLRALSLLLPRCPRAHLCLVGEGEQREALQRLAGELRIEPHVHWLGLREDVPQLLRSADAFISSSVSEGACLAILEAMAAGLPVVATDVGGNRELVQRGHTGLLSRRGDAPAMAENLHRLLADGNLRRQMGLSGRRRAREKFSQRDMHDSFIHLYRQMAGETA